MSNGYKYSLDKSSKKFICPGPDCGRKRFVRYIDAETGEYLPEEFGRCDRSDNCGYHRNPFKEGFGKSGNNSIGYSLVNYSSAKPYASEKFDPVFIPNDVLKQTIKGYDQNTFIQYLLKKAPFPFTVSDIEKVIALYRLGTVTKDYLAGGLTIPFIDENEKVRAIQVKLFDETNRTIKHGWINAILAKHHTRRGEKLPIWLEAYQKADLKVSTLFGAHLLHKYPTNRIALVEAPKTAIYGTLYFGLPEGPDDLLWFAVFNKSTLDYKRCKVLQNRTVYLFPDLSKDGNTFNEWKERATDLQSQIPGLRFVVSDLLEKVSGPLAKSKGADLADLLITKDWRLFRKQAPQTEVKAAPSIQPETKPEQISAPEEITSKKVISTSFTDFTFFTSGSWINSLNELDNFFPNVQYPDCPFMLNAFTPVNKIDAFLSSSLEVARAQNGNPTYRPYLNRAIELMQYLKTNTIN